MASYCYRFRDINGNVIYVGKTVDINIILDMFENVTYDDLFRIKICK